jgi:hypothetical protein
VSEVVVRFMLVFWDGRSFFCEGLRFCFDCVCIFDKTWSTRKVRFMAFKVIEPAGL